ncbi:MAG TPA: ABC transporter ATP-binding protein, partial [Vicingus sp.]|nr:ABC transporter ATP-binding protein [Vicingus sp.]
MIVIENIHKSYGNLEVLKGVYLSIDQGKVISIVGASGAGKSTLLQIIGTLDKPNTGSLKINDIDVFGLKDKELSLFRNKNIGFVFQFHHLLPEFTALENVCIPAFINKTPKPEAEKRAIELLTSLGLKDRIHHKPSELSGGEAQRVAVCRALINNPA